jgi:hypothetical protein
VNVPRPLLVLVVVIIVLGVLSCGAGVFRGIQEDTATPAPMTGLITAPVPPGDVSVSTPNGGTCSIAGSVITVGSNCRVTVDPQTFRPRKLYLGVATGTLTAVVRQEIRGRLQSSNSESPASGTFSISVAGSSPVLVDLTCLSPSCGLTVRASP